MLFLKSILAPSIPPVDPQGNMPPRRQGSNSILAQRTVDEILRAAEFLPDLIGSGRTAGDVAQRWQHVSILSCTVSRYSAETAVLQQLVLQSDLPQQLCSCLVKVLRHVAAAAGSLDAQDPALAVSQFTM
jgi:hypothetical protein